MSTNLESPKNLLAVATIASLVAIAHDAHAVEPADKSAAEALFRAGRTAMEAGRYAEACPKLAESQRLDPAAGTLMNLGECYTKNGQTASAWVTFTEAARAAAARKREDWRATATARVHELEPQLSMLVIQVDQPVSGMKVTRDGSLVGEPQWGAAVPVDPGTHEIVAEAPSRRSWRSAAVVPSGPQRIVVRVPALAESTTNDAPSSTTSGPAAATSDVKSDDRTQDAHSDPLRPIAIGALAVGGAAIVASAVTGLMATSAANDADRLCPSSPCSDRGGLDANDRAHDFATVSTITGIAGLALAVGGIALLFWPQSSSAGATSRTGTRVIVRPFALGATW